MEIYIYRYIYIYMKYTLKWNTERLSVFPAHSNSPGLRGLEVLSLPKSD